MSGARQPTAPSRRLPRELRTDLRFRAAGLLGAGIVRLWGATLLPDWIDVRGERVPGPATDPGIFTFWHSAILTLTYFYRSREAVVLISRHDDGEYISQTVCRLGYGVIRGSTTRGGLRALMEMARAGRHGHPLGVTPDGPRGPRRVLQMGVLHIAQRSGLPIRPLAAEAVRRTEFASWDGFQVAHPWSRVVLVSGDPILIPSDAVPEELEAVWAPRVTAAMDACTERAELWRTRRTMKR